MSQLLFIQAYNNLFSILVCKSKGVTFHVEFLINLIPFGEVRRPFIMNIPTSKKLITCKLGCIYTIDASVKKRTNKLRDSSQRLNYNIPKPFCKIKEPPILEAYHGKNKRLKERQRLLVNSRPFSINIFYTNGIWKFLPNITTAQCHDEVGHYLREMPPVPASNLSTPSLKWCELKLMLYDYFN